MTKRFNIALFPDRIAHYRIPIFKALANIDELDIQFYYSQTPSVKSISQQDPASIGLKGSHIKELVIKEKVFWQTKIINATLNPKYDIIVCWGEAHRVSTWIATLLSAFTRKPIVMWTHGVYGNENILKLAIRISFYRLSNHLLLYGEKAEKALSNYINNKNLSVIYNALDYKLQTQLRDSISERDISELKQRLIGNKPNQRVIIYTGRLTVEKKLSQLIELITILSKSKFYNYVLIMVGDGPMRSDLEELSANKGVSNSIHFLGACYKEESLAKLFLISDLCISPANIGLTALHALAYGTAIASHSDFNMQKPESECIHPGKNGFLFRKDNVLDIASKTEEWFNNNITRESIVHYCTSKIFPKYNIEKQSKVFLNAVKMVLNPKTQVI